MRLMSKLMTGAGMLALSTGFAAAAPAVVENDLNLRSGPGVEFPVIAAMPGGATVDVMGCEASWCRVAYNGAVGWASRAYMGLGGSVASGPAYRTYGEGYAYGGYGPGYAYEPDYGYEGSYGYSPGYYGGSYGYYGGERTFNNERTFSNERTVGEGSSVRTERRGAADVNVRAGEQRAAAIKGNNPMRVRESTANPNLPRAEGQAATIKGNNPMKAEKNEAAVPNAQAPSAIKGNNPMKVGRSTPAANNQRGTAQAGATRGNARETTGAAPRENRPTQNGY